MTAAMLRDLSALSARIPAEGIQNASSVYSIRNPPDGEPRYDPVAVQLIAPASADISQVLMRAPKTEMPPSKQGSNKELI